MTKASGGDRCFHISFAYKIKPFLLGDWPRKSEKTTPGAFIEKLLPRVLE